MPHPDSWQNSKDIQRIILVTGLSGAGKTTALKSLEDLGYDVVDNLPINLFEWIIVYDRSTQDDSQNDLQKPETASMAFGIDVRNRHFDPKTIIDKIDRINTTGHVEIQLLYLNCGTDELINRFSKTRRRHPLGIDRPLSDGIHHERELLRPLHERADHIIDTTGMNQNDLGKRIQVLYAGSRTQTMTITILSFGYGNGIPRDVDLLFDMRFLVNPHWVPELKSLTGLDQEAADYIMNDAQFQPVFQAIYDLLKQLIPGYRAQQKSYLTIGFGCTGGRHRSVLMAEQMNKALSDEGYRLTVLHRDINRS